MRAGALKNLVTIQQRQETSRSALNAPVYSWPTWRQAFCEITTRRGGEFVDEKAQQRFTQVLYRFRFRFEDVDGVDSTMRIVGEDGEIFRIVNILPDEQFRRDCIVEAVTQNPTV